MLLPAVGPRWAVLIYRRRCAENLPAGKLPHNACPHLASSSVPDSRCDTLPRYNLGQRRRYWSSSPRPACRGPFGDVRYTVSAAQKISRRGEPHVSAAGMPIDTGELLCSTNGTRGRFPDPHYCGGYDGHLHGHLQPVCNQ